ncbi:hypothetical protein LPY66_18160 [Dehalobacter sp. DCM]|uniref:hypothetical protein n=1 Tax=Dehalobacter sp. DCM TaxID=2907827 RepID=UPI003081829B|nr:hypothetical protein LPY66_18160 [Dehalobacter sp. DCM]
MAIFTPPTDTAANAAVAAAPKATNPTAPIDKAPATPAILIVVERLANCIVF